MRSMLYKLFALAVLTATACIVDPTSVKPMLATWDPSKVETFMDATVGNGTLEVTPACVFLILANSKRVLLVWPEPTVWNSLLQAIEFTSVQGESATLHNGDQIMPGGAPATENSPLVVPPDPACQADETFIVSTITMVKE